MAEFWCLQACGLGLPIQSDLRVALKLLHFIERLNFFDVLCFFCGGGSTERKCLATFHNLTNDAFQSRGARIGQADLHEISGSRYIRDPFVATARFESQLASATSN
jgi:hypothetical protein